MIGYFPVAYPDEVFYSLCARFSDRTQFSNKKTIMERLFGSKNVIPTVDLPSCLEHFANTVGFPELYNPESVIQNHTLLPVYAPFIPNYRLEQIKADMLKDRGMGLYMKVGLMANGLKTSSLLRFCPICSANDLSLYGEFYWHRMHQITGVLTCPIHNILLENSSVKRTGNRTRFWFVSANNSIYCDLPTPQPVHVSLKLLTEISCDLHWILTNAPRLGIVEKIHEGYIFLLKKIGLANQNGRLRTDSLVKRFTDIFGLDLLEQLGADLKSVKENWLLRILHKPGRFYHPLQHVLLMRSLGYRAEDFFQFLAALSSETLTGSSIGTVHQINKITKLYQVDMEEKLRSYWQDPQLSLRKIANLLDVDPLTIKRHATRLGLSFPRPSNRCTPPIAERQLKKDLIKNLFKPLARYIARLGNVP
jgi:hypothetical protein